MEGEEGVSDLNDPASTGSYTLRVLVQGIPLLAEEHDTEARITCVELCEDNLYIGTSLAEILHFVSIPANPTDGSQASQYIFASRLQPSYNAQAVGTSHTLTGVQQILVLPKVQKACVLCNGTLSFYSLPELSPAFSNLTVANCTWVGGVDINSTASEQENGVVVMICVKSRIRLVKIREEARRVRDIEFQGCFKSVRRRNFACVADTTTYALLDVENQQKVPLFPISSLDELSGNGKVENISPNLDTDEARSQASSRPISTERGSNIKGHGRSTSLGALVGGLGRRQESPLRQSQAQDPSGISVPETTGRETSPLRTSTHSRNASSPEVPNPVPSTPEKPLPNLPPRSDSLLRAPQAHLPPASASPTLVPHIASPTPDEFLLVTGTGTEEPGVGIFVNLDGDVVRGTLQFDQYPNAVVVDGIGVDVESGAAEGDREGFVLATMSQSFKGGKRGIVELQRWDIENSGSKERMNIPSATKRSDPDDLPLQADFGLRAVDTAADVPFPEVGRLLRGTRLRLPDGAVGLADGEVERNQDELEFGRRLGRRQSRVVLWSGDCIWWMVRTPLVMKLNAAFDGIIKKVPRGEIYTEMERSTVKQIVNSLGEREALSETEFLSLEFVRQKASLALFADLLSRPHSLPSLPLADLEFTEALLMEGGIDPRVLLTVIPLVCKEVIEGKNGIWVHAGLIPIVERYRAANQKSFTEIGIPSVLAIIKRYLGAWRQRKGFGSIADETQVFQTVDAALLLILLEQDMREPRKGSKPSPTRLELYALVDSGVECFDRAITLLEQYRRLFVLSRLYQSRRMARKVLDTWKRIIEGETDEGGGLIDGENEMRRYLANIKDTGLVDEFGTWLARRNPALGVQIFTNDDSRIKWEPHQVVMLLRRKAPDAVKVYLEHLVFGKKNIKYANDLITYYLDSVLTVLESSKEARSILAQSYESYRALHPPKPTYRQFIIENAVPVPWWHDRLRLLELIGGSHGSNFSYDMENILSRIEPFEESLVPESIILDGRQGRHKQALHLLTHGLGDYHTAVNYCLLGGASIFHPTSGSAAAIAAPSQGEQAILFGYLLTEFLHIDDVSDRLERTSELLDRFGSWYDVREVLDLIPESWSVELVSGFLVSSFRRLVHEKNEATITKALSGAENLQIASAFTEKCTAVGPQIENGPSP